MRQGAFTIIELILVAAIVAMLVTLLVPMMRTTRSSASGLQCGANQRQIAMAVMQYATEWEGTLPWSLISIGDAPPPELTTGSGTFWSTPILGEYLGIRLDSADVWKAGGSVRIMRCPVDDQSASFAGMADAGITQAPSYGLNRWLCPRKPGAAWATAGGAMGTFRSVSRVKGPAVVPLVADTAGDPGWMPGVEVANPPCTPYADLDFRQTWGLWPGEPGLEPWLQVPRHHGKTAIAFLDGHTALLALPLASAQGDIRAGRP